MKKHLSLVALLGGLLLLPAGLRSADPALVHYQFRLASAAGAELSGPVIVGFRIYADAPGTDLLWGETQALSAERGIVTADLGRVQPFPAGLFRRPALFLGVRVNADPEMRPLVQLAGAFRAASASRIGGRLVAAGGAMLTAAGANQAVVHLDFGGVFSAAPAVMVGAPRNLPGGVVFVAERVTEVTAAGCNVHFASLSGAAATGSASFDWIAIGR
jgi:hypothetical protein